MELLITLIIYAVIFAILYWVIMEIMATINAPGPWPMIVKVVFLLICLLVIVDLFFGSGYFPRIHIRG